jgi:hypothetical protein
MKYKAIKGFLHDKLGRVQKGQVFEDLGYNLSPVRKFLEPYDTKVIVDYPAEPAGAPLSASPAGQASPEQTATPRRRGRPRRVSVESE